MPFWLVYKKGYCCLSTKSMHVNIAARTIINSKICFVCAQDALVRTFRRKVKLERMFDVGRIIDLKWRLDTFFVIPMITVDTEIIVCADLLDTAHRAIVAWISFFIVAPKQREYIMIKENFVTKERRKLEIQKGFRYLIPVFIS